VTANRDNSRRGSLIAGAVIAGAAAAAYWNTFSVPFIFDDPLSIAGNPTIRHLWPPWLPLFPPHGQGLTVEGRPILNLSLAIDYAISGIRVWSYHATNLLIHIMAGLTLFGIVRRTLERWKDDSASFALAFAAALIWTVHPLQTESVTYIVQRAESLMGLFYMLTLYCFIRCADEAGDRLKAISDRPEPPADKDSSSASGPLRLQPKAYRLKPLLWGWLSIGACLLGMATKEVMVSAPLIVFLYDRTFITGTFAEAWRRRRGFYLGLAGTWLLLIFLAADAGNRGRTVGFGIGATPWDYAPIQFQAIVHYLRLSVWPRPLIFDYGAQWLARPSDALWDAIVVTALLAGSAWDLLRPASRTVQGQALGFAGALFFLILAPTSVVPLVRQTIAEHRMYLPLAAVIAVAVCGIHGLVGRTLDCVRGRRHQALVSSVIFAALAAVCLAATAQRNQDYRSKVVLYRDTVAKRPDNVLAHYDLALALAESGAPGESIPEFEETLRLAPEFPQAHYNLGNALSALGRMGDAAAHYEAALRMDPNYAEAHFALGNTLLRLGRKQEARWHFNAAYLINPNFTQAGKNRDEIDK
jgi:protein O-mannosyl-transferase